MCYDISNCKTKTIIRKLERINGMTKKSKGGRPRLPSEKRKDHINAFRSTPVEQARLLRLTNQTGLTTSALIRATIVGLENNPDWLDEITKKEHVNE